MHIIKTFQTCRRLEGREGFRRWLAVSRVRRLYGISKSASIIRQMIYMFAIKIITAFREAGDSLHGIALAMNK